MPISTKHEDLLRGFQMALRAAVSATAAVVVAQLLGMEYPIYAMISAVIVTDLDPRKTRQLSVQRLIATIVGATCGAVQCQLFQVRDWTIGLSILVTILLCHFLKLQGAAKVAGYVCGIVVLSHSKEAWTYAASRSVETVLGIGIGWCVSFVPKLIRMGEPDSAT